MHAIVQRSFFSITAFNSVDTLEVKSLKIMFQEFEVSCQAS